MAVMELLRLKALKGRILLYLGTEGLPLKRLRRLKELENSRSMS